MKKFIYLLLTSLIVLSSCTETRSLGARQFTVKKVKGQEKWAFQGSSVFYDKMLYDPNDESNIYIGCLGDDKWLLDDRGNRVLEEPLLEMKRLGFGLSEVLEQTDVCYYRFTTAKGVYFGYTDYKLNISGGPHEDIFMLDYGAYMYKQNGKWAYFRKGFPADYDVLIQIVEYTKTSKSNTYFIYRKGDTWGAVNNRNQPVAISQKKIREYLAIKPNDTMFYQPHHVTELFRERIGNDEVGQMIICDVRLQHVGAL